MKLSDQQNKNDWNRWQPSAFPVYEWSECYWNETFLEVGCENEIVPCRPAHITKFTNISFAWQSLIRTLIVPA